VDARARRLADNENARAVRGTHDGAWAKWQVLRAYATRTHVGKKRREGTMRQAAHFTGDSF
jgi:hypothetical protein